MLFRSEGLDAPIASHAKAFANAGYMLWHANQAARYNILHDIMPPASGFWKNNPHADCIDYQIESDFAGLMSPAMPNTASSISVTGLNHYLAKQSGGSFAGTVTNQYGFLADSSLSSATNNYGFYSNIASGTGKYNFYANGTAYNYFAGNVGIGSSVNQTIGLRVAANLTGGASTSSVWVTPAIQTDVTSSARVISSYPSTVAGATYNQ